MQSCRKKFFFLLTFFYFNANVHCFIPSRIIDLIASQFNKELNIDLGLVSETLTHEEITRLGLIKSIARYLDDLGLRIQNKNGRLFRKKLTNLTAYGKDVRYLYKDFYGKWYDRLDIDYLIEHVFKVNVASVDFDARTKDLPYAHFDAETFQESNRRVIQFGKLIRVAILRKDYSTARKLTAQILHTIQDFYSHSNWIEMGHVSEINTAIGEWEFEKQLENTDKIATCISNCTLIRIHCSELIASFMDLVSGLLDLRWAVKCPLEFYNCSNNLLVGDRLVSGYYSNQRLDNGVAYKKVSSKCSHGGVLDADSYVVPALGGINKDAGYYFFSPHANLHQIAAQLAINHTEYFFNQLRASIGDKEFNRFLQIEIKHHFYEFILDFLRFIFKYFFKN